MRLSKETLAVLKNYSSINKNIVLDDSKTLMSATGGNTIFSKISIPEQFPEKFGIYDIDEFVGVLSLFSEPELDFKDNSLLITQGNNSIRYLGANLAILKTPTPNQFVKLEEFMEGTVVSFDITGEFLTAIQKTAGVIKAPDLYFVADGVSLKLCISDLTNSSSNVFEHKIQDTNLEFKVNLKTENLKISIEDYVVSISKTKAVRFKSKTTDLVYYVAFEATSQIS